MKMGQHTKITFKTKALEVRWGRGGERERLLYKKNLPNFQKDPTNAVLPQRVEVLFLPTFRKGIKRSKVSNKSGSH